MKGKERQCFIVGPIGKSDGQERIHSDWLLEAIIEPVFSEHYSDFKVLRADKISKAGMINTQIIEALLDADLVIADITTLNPNAFYEIGIRHMAQKPIIHMHLAGQSIPFDIAPFRSIEFSLLRPTDLETAKRELKQFVEEVLDADYKVDNPVTVARGKVALEQTATEGERVLLDELEALKGRVAGLESSSELLAHFKPIDAVHTKNGRRMYSFSNAARHPQFRIDIAPRTVQSTQNFQRDAMGLVEMLFPSYQAEPNGELVVTIYVKDTPDNRAALNALKSEAEAAEYRVSIS